MEKDNKNELLKNKNKKPHKATIQIKQNNVH